MDFMILVVLIIGGGALIYCVQQSKDCQNIITKIKTRLKKYAEK